MSLTDKETHQKGDVLFSGSMRHRKLPRARRRKKRTPEITAQPVGTIDPLTGEITVSDEVDAFSKTDSLVPEEVIDSLAEDAASWKDETDSVVVNSTIREDIIDSVSDDSTLPEDMIDPVADDSTLPEDMIDPIADDMIIPNDQQDFNSSDDLLWTDLDDAGIDEDNESDDKVDVSDFSTGTGIEDTYRHDITDAEEIQTAAKAKEMRKAEASDEDMFLADIEDEDTEVESEDDLDDEERDDEESSGRFSLSNIFKRTRTDKKKKKKSQSRRKKAPSKGKKSSADRRKDFTDADYDDDLADDMSEDPDDYLATDEREDPDYDDDLTDDENEDSDYDDSEDDESDTEDGESEEPEEPEVVHNPVIRYDPDLTYGLTAEEVSDREAEGLINVTVRKGQKTVRQIVLSHTLTYFNLLNILLGILVATTGQWKNMLFLGIIIGNSAIGIFQELKVKSLIDNLTVITAARVTAIRDGSEEEMPVDNIVVDDVIKLGPGDQVVTDGRVFDCRGLEVNESMLTGESQAVKKKDGDQVLSGSFIIAGAGRKSVPQEARELRDAAHDWQDHQGRLRDYHPGRPAALPQSDDRERRGICKCNHPHRLRHHRHDP